MDTTLKGKRILVVGAAGFIGRHVTHALENSGANVVGFDYAGPSNAQSHFPWVSGSLTDPTLFATAVSDCYGVVFLANSSLPNTSNLDLAAEIDAHVKVSVNAAEICCRHNVSRFIFASSGGTVYGHDSADPLSESAQTTPRNAYGVSKLSIEHYLRLISAMRSMETVSLRISNPYGPGQRAHRNQGFIAAAFQNLQDGATMPIWGDGSVERDFVYVSDVAQAFLAALLVETPPHVVNIGAGQATSLLSILELIEQVHGQAVPVEFEPSRIVDVKRNVLDISKARKTLGWEPRTSLVAGLEKTDAWWRKAER